MNILLLTWEFSPILGGAGAFARDVCLALGESGHSVTVLTADFSSTHKREQIKDDELLAAKSVDVIRLSWPHPFGYFTIPWKLKSFLAKRRKQFDRFWITDSKAHAVASKLPFELMGAYAVVIHGGELPRHFDARPLWLNICYSSKGIRSLFRKAEVLMGISQSTVDWISKYGFQSRNITLGVDPSLFFPVRDPHKIADIRKSFGMRTEDRVVLTACRLEATKGVDTLIRAFVPLAAAFPTTSIWIAGDGEDRGRLENIAKDLGISDRIRFTGSLQRTRLRELMQVCEIFAMITRYDNFGLVFIEANACGKAVLAGRTGGVSNAVEHGVSGLLVDPYKVEDVSRDLAELLSDDKLRQRLERDGEERYREGFTHIHTARQMLKHTEPAP
ncbi:MAG: glycosyltransferase family 4 protein [Fibrobacteria bacterium]